MVNDIWTTHSFLFVFVLIRFGSGPNFGICDFGAKATNQQQFWRDYSPSRDTSDEPTSVRNGNLCKNLWVSLRIWRIYRPNRSYLDALILLLKSYRTDTQSNHVEKVFTMRENCIPAGRVEMLGQGRHTIFISPVVCLQIICLECIFAQCVVMPTTFWTVYR